MAVRLLTASSAVSLLLLVGLGLGYLWTGSELALAQAADSFADALTGLGLLWALRVARRPPDEKHVYGHQGAQPIAALVVAMLVGALALQVGRGAIEALVSGTTAVLAWPVAAMLALKVVIKLAFVRLTSGRELLESNATVRAFRIDARSDAIVGTASLLGFVGARIFDLPSLDAWLALPVAVWIGISGLGLARESIELLMGTAPPRAWQEAVVASVAKMPGVRAVAGIKAHSFGDGIHVWLDVRVDPSLTVAAAHDLGEAVEARLEEDPGISDAVVHVDAAVGSASKPRARPFSRRSG